MTWNETTRPQYRGESGRYARAVVQIPRTAAKLGARAFFGSGGKHRSPDLWRCFASRSELAQCESTFPDPMHELDAGDRDRRAPKSLAPEHRTQTKLDGSVVLFN